MTQNVNTYGGIGIRTNVYADTMFLDHAAPKQILERYTTTKTLPKNKTMTISFRRSIPFNVSDVPLQEGVTPTPEGLQYEDVQATIRQFGNWVQFSDIIADTHEDPILKELTLSLSQQAAQTRELVNWGVFRAGTNVYYGSTAPTPTQRTDVNAPLTIQIVRRIEQFLDNQYATRITKGLRASSDYGTSAVPEGYVGIGHTDLRGDLYDMPGFTRAERYGSGKAGEDEIGAGDGVRFILSAFLKPLPGTGSTTLNGMRSTNGRVDVYPIIFFGEDAMATIPLAANDRPIMTVMNPKPSASDPLGQRGFVAYKMYHAALILNQNWLVRAEVGSTA